MQGDLERGPRMRKWTNKIVWGLPSSTGRQYQEEWFPKLSTCLWLSSASRFCVQLNYFRSKEVAQTLHFLWRKTINDSTMQQQTQMPSTAPMVARKTDSVRMSSGSSWPNMQMPSLSHIEHPPGQATQLKFPASFSILSLENPWVVSFGT